MKSLDESLTPGESLTSGRRVGSYVILDALSRGSFGEVYRAISAWTGEDVAVKVSHERISAETASLHDQGERLLAGLRHESIVAVLDRGVLDDGRPYTVMELAEGENLSALQNARSLSLERAVDIVRRIAEGLAYLHAHGVVHNDVKLNNIIVTEDGQPRLVDFGIAKRAGESPRTGMGTVLGTPAYMAPEVLTGNELGPPSDVFALGVVAYTLLGGRMPFEGTNLANILVDIVQRDPEPLININPEIPRALDEAVRSALRKDPSARPTAGELATALKDAMDPPTSAGVPALRQGLATRGAQTSRERADPFELRGAFATMELAPPDEIPSEAAALLDQPGVVGVLLITSGEDRGRYHAISADMTIGRGEGGPELQLNSPSVSRYHSHLRVVGNTVSVQDLGSRNGTHVNGRAVREPVRLEHGDELRVGQVAMLFLQRRSPETPEMRRRLVTLEARWQLLVDAATEGGSRFFDESRQLVDEHLREAIGLRVEREIPMRRGVIGFLVEAPMLWIAHTRFPILFLPQDDDPALIDRLAEFLQAGQLLGYFVVIVAVPPPGETTSARALRERINGSPYRYDFVVLDRDQITALVRDNEARAFVEIILEQGTDPGSLSPYVVRGPVPENMFFGREREVKTLTQGIGSRSFAVVAGRRMGKSSILLRVQRALASDPRYAPLYLNCEDRTTRADFLEMLADAGDMTNDWSDDPALVRPRIAVLRDRAGGRMVVLLLDEIDALLAHDAARGGQLFRALRAVAHEGRCRFVFSGSRTLYQHLHDPASPFFNFCEELLLRPLDDKTVDAIVRKPMRQLGFKLMDPDRLVAQVTRVTSAHPNLVQIVCQRLVAGSLDRQVASEAVLRIAAQRDVQRSFVETLWSDTTPFERIVSLIPADQAFSLADVQAEVRRRGLPDDGRVAEALEMLELYSLVARDEDGYRFAMPAYPVIVRRSHDVEALISSLARKVEA